MLCLLFLVVVQGEKCDEAPRLRREIRSLDPSIRQRYFEAMKIMKFLPKEIGIQKYGPMFKTYDEILLQHFYAGIDVRCDQGHFSAGFFTFHRSLVLTFENSLLAIDPSIGGVPYWNYELDLQENANPSKSVIWSDDYYGPSEGDPENGWQIKSGTFKNWSVAYGKFFEGPPRLDLQTDTLVHGIPSNPYGYLRGFANSNPAPRVTRSHQQCGQAIEPYWGIKQDALEGCLNQTDYMSFFNCMDYGTNGADGPHTFIHSWLGGAWGSHNCTTKQLDTGISDNVNGCLACSTDINYCQGRNLTECVCLINHQACQRMDIPNATCQRYPGGDERPDYHPNAPCKRCPACRQDPQMGAAGDFWDGLSSPNEPLFFSHHANVDRSFMTWQLRVASNDSTALPFSGFPKSGYCPGHNLHDTISSSFPFFASELFYHHPGPFTETPLTHAEVLRRTQPRSMNSTFCSIGNDIYAYDLSASIYI